MFRITLNNYRCFSDEKPAVIEIDSGFTALIGANNSGKSSVLRFFLEFRNLFWCLANWPQNGPFNVSLLHVEDWDEVFCNRNRRSMIIDIENPGSGRGWLAKIRFTLERSQKNTSRFQTWTETTYGETVSSQSWISVDMMLANGNQYTCNSSKFVQFAKTVIESIYIGPFRNAISEGAGSYYDVSIGTSFISQWDIWKTGATKAQNSAAQNVADDIAHIFDFKRFEINAAPDKKSLQVIIDGKSYRLRELGAGLAQFIIVFGNVAIRRPGLLLIDEPELNLHPSLQIDFLTSLASYATYGVMFASHSVGLARAVSDRIYSFQKKGDAPTVKPFEQTPNYAEFAGEMSFSSFKEIGCDRILLVEGVTEVKAVQQFLRALGKDHTIVIIPMGGGQLIRGGVQQELHELTRLSTRVAVLIDSERAHAGQALAPDREAFVQDCLALKFEVHVTTKRAFENYLTERAIQEEKGEKFKCLADYDRLKDAQNAWAKSDNWRIARRMTRDEILATDIGAFLDGL
jgi:ABC-type phosphate transport system ATPase subunit